MDENELTQEVENESLPVDVAPEEPSLAPESAEVTGTPGTLPEAAAQPAEFTGIRDYLGSQNFDSSRYQSDEEAVHALLQRAQHAEQAAREAAYWRHLAQQSQQQPTPHAPAPQTQAEKKSYWSKPPEFDPAWRQLLRTDESGNIVAVPGAAPDLPQKYRAYLQWQQEQQAKLLADPVEAIWPGVQERLDSILAEREEKFRNSYVRDIEARQYLNQLLPHLYQVNPQTGQPLVDPSTGQPALSPYGQAYIHYMDQACQITADPTARRQYAENMARSYVMQLQGQQPAAPAPAAPAPQQRKKNFLQAQHQPNRAGTEGEETQNRQLSFAEKLRADLVRAGHLSESAA